MKKTLLTLSIIGLIINFVEAMIYNIKWGIGLRNFDLDTLLGIGLIAIIVNIVLFLMKVGGRKTISIVIGSLYGFYKAIKLYSMSNGMLGIILLFKANHTITITLTIIILTLIISINFEKNKSKKVDVKEA